MNNAKRLILGFFTLLIIFMIYRISILLLILGLKGASRQIFFISLSILIFIPLLKNIKFKGYDVESAEINRKINKVYKKFKDSNITRLQNITLKHDKRSIKVDSLIISEKGVFNIAYCNEKGHIVIKENNIWVKRNRRGIDEEITSPIKSIRQNREILRNIYNEDEVIDLIVIVNDRSDFEEEVSSVPIIRYDDIEYYISNYESEEIYDSEELYDRLYGLKFKTENIEDDLKIYNKYLDYKWQYRSRLAIVSFCFLFYIIKVIEIS